MKAAIMLAAGTLVCSLAALLGIIGYTSIGRALGQHWSSLDGPEPVWPAIVGFGAFYLIVISAVALVALMATLLIRERRRAHIRAGR